jgi:serine protease
VDRNRELAYYSNYGTTIDVAAPGGDVRYDIDGDGNDDGVLSTVGNDSRFNGSVEFGYTIYQGTSMASPHMAGVAALMKAINPTMSPIDFDAYLASGNITEDIGTAGRDNFFGHGLVDAYKAVIAAGGTPPVVPAQIVVGPTALNYSYSRTSLAFTVSNGGNEALTGVSANVAYTGAAGWLTVTPQAVDGEGVGTYTAVVDRAVLSGSPDNIHVATIELSATEGDPVNIPVIMALSNLGLTNNAGFHYVILFDLNGTASSDNSQLTQLNAVNGFYNFQFNDVEPGSYLLVASTDNDNDYYICTDGEACGIYMDWSNPTEIVVTSGQASVANLDFQTGYPSALRDYSVGSRFNLTGGFRVPVRTQDLFKRR